MTERRRAWVFRMVLATGAPVVAALALELSLRLGGYGHESGFLIADNQPGYLRGNPAFARLFLPDNFDLRPLAFRIRAQKPPHTLRIVVLGESAAQGVPVAAFGFAQLLRAQLRAAYPGTEIEVIDTGIVAINSHVVYRIAADMAACHPDLFIAYVGNNEVIGPYGPGCAYLNTMPPLWLIRLSVAFRGSRTGQWLTALATRAGRRHSADWGGMSMFVSHQVPGDDPRLGAVYGNFHRNLEDIGAVAQAAGAKMLFCTVVSNWRDCPPFLALHRTGMSTADMQRWDTAQRQGLLEWRLGELNAAYTTLSAAKAIDPQFADTWFVLGDIDRQRGEIARAREELAAALHWDGLRFRPDPEINRTIRGVAGPQLLDLASAMGADPESSAPLAGRQWLFEHVHFDFPGNARVAELMAEKIRTLLPATSAAHQLTPEQAAQAIGYTPHERAPMLLRMEELVRKPPFSHQLTYVEDEAAITRAIAAAQQDARSSSVLASAAKTIAAARAADPENPALPGIAEGIDLDRGEIELALADARRAQELLPRDGAAVADEAELLIRLGRLEEARQLLDSVPPEVETTTVARLDWFRAAKDDVGAQSYVTRALAARPEDRQLRLLWASHLESQQHDDEAAQAYRAVLAQDPANAAAFNRLIALLDRIRPSDADMAIEALWPHQLSNQNANLRRAQLAARRNDPATEITALSAAESSGPVSATFELTLALKLYQGDRAPDAIMHLAMARRLAVAESRPDITAAIDRLIARLRH